VDGGADALAEAIPHLNLDAAIAAAGISYTNDSPIKFRQYHNYRWGLDGRAFDNIFVTA
jgi:hypothetical protein